MHIIYDQTHGETSSASNPLFLSLIALGEYIHVTYLAHHQLYIPKVNQYMVLWYIHVHVLTAYTCTCTYHMYMYLPHVHVRTCVGGGGCMGNGSGGL